MSRPNSKGGWSKIDQRQLEGGESRAPGLAFLIAYPVSTGWLSRLATFQMLHKLRAAMVRPGRDRIGGEWPQEPARDLYDGKRTSSGPPPRVRTSLLWPPQVSLTAGIVMHGTRQPIRIR